MATRKRTAKKAAIIEISSSDDDDDIHSKRHKLEDISNDVNYMPQQSQKKRRTNKEKKNNSKKNLHKYHDKPELISVNDKNNSLQNWQIYEVIAVNENIDNKSAENIVRLFDEENTIPFICRYRRDMINYTITPEKLRDIKNAYNEILELKKRSQTIINNLSKEKVLTDEICKEILSAKTFEQLEFLYAPYKATNKGSLAERAKLLGLEKPSEHLLFGKSPEIKLENYVIKSNPDIDTIGKVSNGICNIITHIMSKSTEVLEELRKLQKFSYIELINIKTKVKHIKNAKDKTTINLHKFEHYFNFMQAIKYIKPHQILAINRGEKLNYLTVTIDIPDKFKLDIKDFIRKQFLLEGIQYNLRMEMFEKSFEECYNKKLKPLIKRQIRSDLNENAKKASIEVFARNLKQLLLMSPLKGEKILGIDPGFTNGCKLALISETSDVLETSVIYPHGKYSDPEKSAEKLIKILTNYGCNVIALGNGTACRETEIWLTNLFETGYLDSNKIQYTIVSEQGASIYSCSNIAKKEFPNLDINVISAVSIARRLNNPLSEYVKIEPRHIGVGMYQHDICEKALNDSLNEVVSECVSFVGVNVNTAGPSILKHIAGLTAAKAEKIIEYRSKNGPFQTRNDLLKVKGIGQKTFKQLAGFIRIEPLSAESNLSNPFDCTWIHPESYNVADKIIEKCNLKKTKLGQPEFIKVIKDFKSNSNMIELEKEFNVPKERISTILEALERELNRDYRSDFNKKPLFKKGITKISELKEGSIVTGAVTNVTHFGAFVDIGVEKDGLIHNSCMNGINLNIGDRVETTVSQVNIRKGYIQLKLNLTSDSMNFF